MHLEFQSQEACIKRLWMIIITSVMMRAMLSKQLIAVCRLAWDHLEFMLALK